MPVLSFGWYFTRINIKVVCMLTKVRSSYQMELAGRRLDMNNWGETTRPSCRGGTKDLGVHQDPPKITHFAGFNLWLRCSDGTEFSQTRKMKFMSMQ